MNQFFKSKSAYRLRASMRLTVLGLYIAVATGCTAFGTCSSAECSQDAKITAEVRKLFTESSELGGPNQITIQTVHGVVYLSGLVSTPYQISTAGSIAESASGVIEVQNLLNLDNAH